MARQKSEVTLAIEALVAENPDITASEALPKLAEAGYGDVKDYTFNNLKSKLQRGVVQPSTPSKGKGKGSGKAKASRPKVHKPEVPAFTLAESVETVRTDFEGGVDEAEQYAQELLAKVAVIREYQSQLQGVA